MWAGHEGSVAICDFRLTLTRQSLWNGMNLHSSDHIKRLQCSVVRSWCRCQLQQFSPIDRTKCRTATSHQTNMFQCNSKRYDSKRFLPLDYTPLWVEMYFACYASPIVSCDMSFVRCSWRLRRLDVDSAAILNYPIMRCTVRTLIPVIRDISRVVVPACMVLASLSMAETSVQHYFRTRSDIFV